MGVSRAALELVLQARDEASSIIGKASGALGGLGNVAAAVATGGMAAVAAGAVAVGAGAVAAGVAVLDFSSDTDEAMRLLQAQVGASNDEMADFKQQAKDVFASGWGEDIGGISEAMAQVNLALDEQGDALEDSTRRALILRDTFEIDIAEGASAAAAAVKSGLVDSSEEAFDLITSGFHEGLNQAGDFQDTLREYSNDFSRLGFEADDMLGALNAGLEAGAYNTDVVADGIREFGIRFGGAEESATQALDAIGVDSEALYALYQSGEITVADAMATITGALGDVDDKTLQAQAGAALFGSKWEDIGGDVFIAAGQAQDSIGTLAGVTDAAGETLSSGLGASIERLKRTALANLAPLGDIVTDALGKAQPYIDKATLWLGENLPVAVDWLKGKWDAFFPKARDATLNFWRGIQPGLIWIRDMFDRFSTGVLPHLSEAWDTLQAGWMIVRGVLRDDLAPALETLRESLGLNSENTGDLMETIGDFAGTIAVSGIKGLIVGISWAIGYVADGAERAARLIDAFKRGLDNLRSVVQWVRDRINELQDAFSRLTLPDWLIPGSPTPFELGLRGIGDALNHLPDLTAQLSVGAAGAPMAMAGAGAGGGMVQIANYFGPGSVRSDEDIEEIARRTEELLNIRGLRTWEV